MGFLLQLSLLLWKNWKLKTRNVWVTIVEMGTPLVLFIVLVGLRYQEPVFNLGQSYFNPQPLPSAGVLAVLQQFCPGRDGTSKFGYPIHKHMMIEKFLDNLPSFWPHRHRFLEGLDLDEQFNEFDRKLSNLSNHSRNLFEATNTSSNRKLADTGNKLRDIFKQPTVVETFLRNNVSFTTQETSKLMNSQIDFKKVQSLITNSPFGKPRHRQRRSATGRKQANFNNEDTSGLGYLLEMATIGYNGLLVDPSKLSPEQRQLRVQQYTGLVNYFLTPTMMSEMICEQDSPIDDDVLRGFNSSDQIEAMGKLCRNPNTMVLLTSLVKTQLNESELLDEFDRASTHMTADASFQPTTDYLASLESVMRDINSLQEFWSYSAYLMEVAKFFPDHSCLHDEEWLNNNQVTNNTISNTTINNNTTTQQPPLSNHTTVHQSTVHQDDQKDQRNEDDPMNFYVLWDSLQPLWCGGQKSNESLHLKNIADVYISNRQKRHLGVLFYLLASNPKVLYAPDTPQVQSVMRKANASFEALGKVDGSVKRWLNVSRRIRDVIAARDVERTIKFANQLQDSYHHNPVTVTALTSGYPSIQQFLRSNNSLPDVADMKSQLDTLDNAACGWKRYTRGISFDWMVGFNSEEEAVHYALNDAYHDGATVFATLVFDVDESGRLPRHVTYKIRQNTSMTHPTTQIRLPYWRPDPQNWDFFYYQFGFVWLQDIMDRAITWEFVGHQVVSPGSYVHEMPYPCFRLDNFSIILEQTMPLFMIFSWVYTIATMVQHIVYEKEHRLKEVMKIMGLSNGVHWLAWFVTSFIQLELVVTVISVLLKYGKVLVSSNLLIIWIFFSVYAGANIMFCFVVSVLFSKAKIASACSGILYFMSYLPFGYMSIQEFVLHLPVSLYAKNLGSLLSTTAFGLGVKYFALYELSGYGVQWNNIRLTPVEGDTYSMMKAIYMLIIDIFLYAALTWYIEAVSPGQYGLPQPWYFPFTRSYWCGHRGRENRCWSFKSLPWLRSGGGQRFERLEQDVELSRDLVEDEPAHLPIGVKIDRLTKIYRGNTKVAVQQLSLNLYQGQITAFLGHNGAGKTTTMSILTGLIPPTSGTAYIQGMDIRTDMLDIRKSMGICPQHNVLFDALTVEEHMWFYAKLKGVDDKRLKVDIDQMLADIGLVEKRHSTMNMLSGGMKRKLSVAIAFVGGSKTVILDEPTAGVDPYSRRAIWDLIMKYKQDRTILLSTHHMDEADLLGDRIAIIADGKLQCCGSSYFLKSTFGDGYRLTLSFASSVASDEDKGNILSSVTEISSFIKEIVPTCSLLGYSNEQATYKLPSHHDQFEHLFNSLSSKLDHFRLSGYGLSDTSLEQVFLKIDDRNRDERGDSVRVEMNTLKRTIAPSSDETSSSSSASPQCSSSPVSQSPSSSHGRTWTKRDSWVKGASGDNIELTGSEQKQRDVTSEGMTSQSHDDDDDEELIDICQYCDGSYQLAPPLKFLRILQGLLMKRLHYARRNWRAVFYQILLPALFVCIAMTVALKLPTAKDSPPMVLSTSQYHNVTHPRGNYVPFSDQSQLFPSTFPATGKDANQRQLINTFSMVSGIGDACLLNPSVDTLSLDSNRTTYEAMSKNLALVSDYFIPSCLASFTGHISHSQFVPPPPQDDVMPATNATPPPDAFRHRTPPCRCDAYNRGFYCDRRRLEEQYGVDAHRVITGDWLLDISGKAPMNDYLLYTTNEYRLHRYGAISFGESRYGELNNSVDSLPDDLSNVVVRDTAQVYYNHKAYHSMPIFLNVLNNAVLRANLPDDRGNPASYGITVINHPLNKTAGRMSKTFLLSGTDVVIASFIIVAMSFVPASFLLFLVAERSSGAKQLQMIGGATPFTYWLSNFIWDQLNYLIPACVCIAILQLFGLPAYTRGENAAAVTYLFLLYGWSMTPLMYPASFYFNIPSTAYVSLIVANLFVGITTVVITFMFSLFGDDATLLAVDNQLQRIFVLFPNYNLGRGLMDLTYNEYMNDYYIQSGQYLKIKSPFEWDKITHLLVAMAIEGVVGFVVTIAIELGLLKWRWSQSNRVGQVDSSVATGSTDVDVANERHRVEELRSSISRDDAVVVDSVTKQYNKQLGKVTAVDGLSFVVSRGQCFGLLGVNGAGKTTTFNILTGAHAPTSGQVHIAGHSMMTSKKAAMHDLGYCPQFDALFHELTSRDHLYLYARLHGIPARCEKKVVEKIIKQFDLIQHADKQSKHLSGGNKRKLSVAIALIGNPSAVLLDEPTTGMDPGARRFLWQRINEIREEGRAVLLTSHSMEECEALCSRIAIMVGGKLQCLGALQHLKHRFGDGYMVTVRTSQPSKVADLIVRTFPSATLKEQHHRRVSLQIPSLRVNLAQLFQLFQSNRMMLNIEDYSVTQTTLDDVFVNFARNQRELTSTGELSTSQQVSAGRRAINKIKSAWGVCTSSASRRTPTPAGGSAGRGNLYLRGSPTTDDDDVEPLLSAAADNDEEFMEDDHDTSLYSFDQAMFLMMG